MPLRPVSLSRPGVVWPARLDPTGRAGPTRHQAAGRQWQRVSRGRYLPAGMPIDTAQRIANAAATLPDRAAVTGWAALYWSGGRWFDGRTPDGRTELPVDLATGIYDIRGQPGTLVSAEHFAPQDLVEHDGLWLTVPARSTLFAMRHAPDLVEATVALDMACEGDVVSIAEATAYAELLPTWTGIPQARAALRLADEDSWSPWETRLRLLWTLLAGCPRPQCNLPVFDPTGRHVGTPDLLDPVAGVVGEYDGAHHLAGPQRSRDVTRESDLRALGLEYVAVVAGQMASPGTVARRIREAYERARWVPSERRLWRVEPPERWHEPRARGVEQRRAEFGRRTPAA